MFISKYYKNLGIPNTQQYLGNIVKYCANTAWKLNKYFPIYYICTYLWFIFFRSGKFTHDFSFSGLFNWKMVARSLQESGNSPLQLVTIWWILCNVQNWHKGDINLPCQRMWWDVIVIIIIVIVKRNHPHFKDVAGLGRSFG